jgi:hypothetical protein
MRQELRGYRATAARPWLALWIRTRTSLPPHPSRLHLSQFARAPCTTQRQSPAADADGGGTRSWAIIEGVGRCGAQRRAQRRLSTARAGACALVPLGLPRPASQPRCAGPQPPALQNVPRAHRPVLPDTGGALQIGSRTTPNACHRQAHTLSSDPPPRRPRSACAHAGARQKLRLSPLLRD